MDQDLKPVEKMTAAELEAEVSTHLTGGPPGQNAHYYGPFWSVAWIRDYQAFALFHQLLLLHPFCRNVRHRYSRNWEHCYYYVEIEIEDSYWISGRMRYSDFEYVYQGCGTSLAEAETRAYLKALRAIGGRPLFGFTLARPPFPDTLIPETSDEHAKVQK